MLSYKAMKRPSDLLGPLRGPFLFLPLACVAAGAGAAFWRTGRIDRGAALLALIGAVCAHASIAGAVRVHSQSAAARLRTASKVFFVTDSMCSLPLARPAVTPTSEKMSLCSCERNQPWAPALRVPYGYCNTSLKGIHSSTGACECSNIYV